jgi:hypothetical protein
MKRPICLIPLKTPGFVSSEILSTPFFYAIWRFEAKRNPHIVDVAGFSVLPRRMRGLNNEALPMSGAQREITKAFLRFLT